MLASQTVSVCVTHCDVIPGKLCSLIHGKLQTISREKAQRNDCHDVTSVSSHCHVLGRRSVEDQQTEHVDVPHPIHTYTHIQTSHSHTTTKKVKEADLYSAFIEVPYTQGAQVRITQC